MRVRCIHCGLDLDVPPNSEGKTLCCPDCRKTFICRLPRAIVVDEAPPPRARPISPLGELLLADEVEEPEEVLELEEEAESLEPADLGPAGAALAALGESAPRREVQENPRTWYVMVAGVAAVAMAWKDLVEKARSGEIKPKDRIYYAPKDVTMHARDVPGLFPEADARRAKAEPVEPPTRPTTKAAGADTDAATDALSRLGAPAPPKAPSPKADATTDALGRLGARTPPGAPPPKAGATTDDPHQLGKERRRQRQQRSDG